MTVKITVESIFQNQAFEQARRESGQLNAALKSQFDERRKIVELQGRLAGAAGREERAAIRANIGEIRRKLSLEQLNTRELKEQISQQRRLNQLTEKLNRDLDQQAGKRRKASGGPGIGDIAAGVGLGIGAADVAGQGVRFVAEGISLRQEQIRVEAQLEAVLRSTGNAAGISAEQIKEHASALEGVTLFGDEAVIGAQNLLLTFTKIGSDIFPQATKTVLDMSTAFDQDLKSSAIQLGKALNDPVEGVSALQRVGVSFTNAQKQQIEAMVKAGDVAGAQALILAELNRQVGGSAAAARDAKGEFGDLAVSWGNLQEEIGGVALSLAELTSSSGLPEFIDLLTDGAAAWRGAIEDIGLLADAQNRLTAANNEGATGVEAWVNSGNDWLETANMFLNPTQALIDKTSELTGAYLFNREALAEQVQQINKEQEAQEAATKAKQDNTDAAEENTEALEAEAKRLEKVAQIRRDFAGSLLDIDEDTQEKINDSWADFYKDSGEEAEKSAKRLADLEKDAAKERAEIQKKLGKDLAKLDRDLARDKEKIGADAEKKIKRLQQDAARENSGDERKRRIDALGDERLFQFELRQLAADGEALRIQEAIERRKIEQEIGEQKRGEEGRAESDDLDLKIQRIREDAQDQVREEEAQARERRALLKEQAEEDRAQLEEQLKEEKDAETAALQERLDKLKETNRERLADIEQSKQESIKKLGEELAQTKDLTVSELEALKPVAAKMGQDVGDAFAEGITRGAERLRDVADMLGEMDERAQKIIGAASLSSPTTFGFAPGRGGSKGRKRPKRFQHGGEFTVGGAGGPDSELVQFFASPGENVKVTPPGAGGANINLTIPISIAAGSGVSEAQVEAIAQRKAQELVTELEQMIGS